MNQRLEGVEKEMSQRNAGGAPQLYEQDGEEKSHSVESHRLVSEDHSHFILIKSEDIHDDMCHSILFSVYDVHCITLLNLNPAH